MQGSARARKHRAADKKNAPSVPLSSRAFSHTRGHLRVSRASLDGLRKKETTRSLLLQSKTWVPLWYRDFSNCSFDSFTKTQQICKLHFLAFFPLACTFPSTSQILTCIDREGLGRRRPGTRQGVSHSQSSLRSSSRLYIVSFSGLTRSCLFVTYPKPETTGRETLEESNPEQKLESFRFEDKNDYEYEIWFKVFSRILKNRHPELFSVLFFTRKDSTVIVIEGGWALSRLSNAKTSNIW